MTMSESIMAPLPPSAKISLKRDSIISRRDIEGLIAQGNLIFIVDGRVIKADKWISFHPGGELTIQHMIGRDATDEVTALHSAEAKRRMNGYQLGRIEADKPWTNFTPPIQGGVFRLPCSKDSRKRSGSGGSNSDTDVADDDSDNESEQTLVDQPEEPTFLKEQTQKELEFDCLKYPSTDAATQQHIIKRYRDLQEQIIKEGLFNCSYSNYAIEVARYATLFGLFAYFLRKEWIVTSAVFLGLFWHQLVFSAHDAGHMGITHSFQGDTIIGIIIADFIGGLSMGWWKRSHNVHHIMTNHVEHDPDIQLLPFFAVSHRFFASVFSSYHSHIVSFDAFSKKVVPYQHYLYYPILCFGRFNLYVQSWIFLLTVHSPKIGPARWHRTLEMVGQAFFWYWFGYVVVYQNISGMFNRVLFVLISHMVTSPLHVQITMSHYAMSTADLGIGESFAQRMLRTTMDVECPQWADFIHGGLQFQAVHHLYPRIPRHNLRRTQKLVQNFCQEVGIPYALSTFIDGNKQVIGRLGEVGKQAALLAGLAEQRAKLS